MSKGIQYEVEDTSAESSKKEEFVENIERRRSTTDEIVDLSGIENEAASKAAWLISLTVSIGGFLFGKSAAFGRITV